MGEVLGWGLFAMALSIFFLRQQRARFRMLQFQRQQELLEDRFDDRDSGYSVQHGFDSCSCSCEFKALGGGHWRCSWNSIDEICSKLVCNAYGEFSEARAERFHFSCDRREQDDLRSSVREPESAN